CAIPGPGSRLGPKPPCRSSRNSKNSTNRVAATRPISKRFGRSATAGLKKAKIEKDVASSRREDRREAVVRASTSMDARQRVPTGVSFFTRDEFLCRELGRYVR